MCACVYRSHHSGSEARHTESTTQIEPQLEPSGDALLDELRRLATQAPIADLVAKRFDFAHNLSIVYRSDVVAWHGIDRLADAVLTDPDFPDRRLFARWLSQVIEHGEPTVTAGFVDKVKDLRLVE